MLASKQTHTAPVPAASPLWLQLQTKHKCITSFIRDCPGGLSPAGGFRLGREVAPVVVPVPLVLAGPRGHPGGDTRGPTTAGCFEEPLLTASFAGAVDGRHPEVGGARVENHREVLGRGPDGNLPEVLHLAKAEQRLKAAVGAAGGPGRGGLCQDAQHGLGSCVGWLAPGQRLSATAASRQVK